jgi:hypothetical protein
VTAGQSEAAAGTGRRGRALRREFIAQAGESSEPQSLHDYNCDIIIAVQNLQKIGQKEYNWPYNGYTFTYAFKVDPLSIVTGGMH